MGTFLPQAWKESFDETRIIVPYLYTRYRYSPKCKLELFHWKQSWAWQEPAQPEVFVRAVCAVSGDHSYSSAKTSRLIGIPLGYHMFWCAPQLLLWYVFVESTGAGGMKLAAGAAIRSNYWLHCLGSFPDFFGLLKSYRRQSWDMYTEYKMYT